MRVTHERWLSLWDRLGGNPPEQDFSLVTAAYAGPKRHYHSLQHLEECLEHLDMSEEDGRYSASNVAAVEAAIWYHDVVYEPLRGDNEARSADWGVKSLTGGGVEASVISMVGELILVTKHDVYPVSGDFSLIVDIDLAILGAGIARFGDYERQIRAEYSGVPGILYRRKRAEVLERFLQRSPLYGTPYFQEHFEARAVKNLKRAIKALE